MTNRSLLLRALFITLLLAAAWKLRAADLVSGGAAGGAALASLTRDEVLESLTHELVAHYHLEGELQLELGHEWTPPTRRAAGWNIDIVDYPSVPSSAMLVRARLLADAVPVGEATFVLRATLWRDAWATRQPLTVGAPFDSGVLEVRRVDFFRERDAVPATVGDHAYVFARALSTGRLLTWHDIARRPLVKKGAVVEVSASDGALLITMKALALENGAQGETVNVRNPESQKNFSAVVVDENHVQVRF